MAAPHPGKDPDGEIDPRLLGRGLFNNSQHSRCQACSIIWVPQDHDVEEAADHQAERQ